VRTQRHDDVGLEDTLRAIERGVLEDVWMSRPRRWTALVAAIVLGVAAASRWSNLGAQASPSLHVDAVVPGTSIMFLVACLVSLVALRRRHFRWCCAAAYTAALSAVTSLAALWWHQTADGSDPLMWTLLAALASSTLTVTWLATILTPLEDSQPDMRAGSH
jgi:peptidoglycan/LPS O-acetylase OafA/YrhL